LHPGLQEYQRWTARHRSGGLSEDDHGRFFEDLPSERASRALRRLHVHPRFLNYSLEEKTPDHSSFTVIRQRLGFGNLSADFPRLRWKPCAARLVARQESGDRFLGDRGHASLRALVHRNTESNIGLREETAAENGIDPEDTAAVRKFDRIVRAKAATRMAKSI